MPSRSGRHGADMCTDLGLSSVVAVIGGGRVLDRLAAAHLVNAFQRLPVRDCDGIGAGIRETGDCLMVILVDELL